MVLARRLFPSVFHTGFSAEIPRPSFVLFISNSCSLGDGWKVRLFFFAINDDGTLFRNRKREISYPGLLFYSPLTGTELPTV